MNTPDDRERALELALRARREPLAEADRSWLEARLTASPDLQRELSEVEALLDRFGRARVEPDPAFQARLAAHLDGLVAAEVLAGSRSGAQPARIGWVRRGVHFLFGREKRPGGPSWGTLILGRALAFYMGIAVVVCLHLATRDPDVGAKASPFPDRAAVEAILPAPSGGPR